MYEYKGTVLRVVDGDTLDVELDLGLDIRVRTKIRLADVNTPELSTDLGKQVKAKLVEYFSDNPEIVVRTIKDRREKYGRYLAKVTTEDGTYLNEWLVQSGFAERA